MAGRMRDRLSALRKKLPLSLNGADGKPDPTADLHAKSAYFPKRLNTLSGMGCMLPRFVYGQEPPPPPSRHSPRRRHRRSRIRDGWSCRSLFGSPRSL